MTKPLIRDFIYLDIERVRSFVAQTSGGLPSERTHQAQHEVGGEGQVEGRLPFVATAKGSTDYHYLRSQSETKSLHDHIFEELYHKLKSAEYIVDLSQVDEIVWSESFFKDSTFVLARGVLKIVDYQSTMATMQGLPSLLETVDKIISPSKQTTPPSSSPNPSKTKGNAKATGSSQTSTSEVQQLKDQMRKLPIKEVASFVNQMYGDVVRVKIFPFRSVLEKVFVGSADRTLFRYSPSALTNVYGSVIDAGWVSILQINKGVHHEPGQLVSKTGNEMEDNLEQVADFLSSLATLAQGVKFPAIAVTPIAIYREI
jgi:hypothetical protein